MKFKVILSHLPVPLRGQNIAYLWANNWNDHGFKTMYHLKYFDLNCKRHDIGTLKIGEFNMKENQHCPNIPDSFDHLSNNFFSLGQDAEYYTNIMSLDNEEIRKKLLASLNDIAADEDLYSRVSNEEITNVSLFRFLTNETVEGQFRRILSGGAQLTNYSFSYIGMPPIAEPFNEFELYFDVKPESRPPTNLHVLIGSNGVGKTYILNSMLQALRLPKGENSSGNRFLTNGEENICPFANLVFVSFSAFDDFGNFHSSEFEAGQIQYSYIGLQKKVENYRSNEMTLTKTPEDLVEEFARSAKLCTVGAKLNRWKKALNVLEVDTVFSDAEIANLVDLSEDDFERESREIYRRLSSGHKIVLLTITRLIECVHEKTLVLMEEPESHLHPPLLSAFIRALSDLLVNRNGVAVVATHSPVVLQEVPRSCVWRIHRHGNYTRVRRPNRQTFAENVGILTGEVFGLEVTRSGFHKMLDKESSEANSVEEVLDKFDDGVGTEGRALISSKVTRKLRNRNTCGA